MTEPSVVANQATFFDGSDAAGDELDAVDRHGLRTRGEEQVGLFFERHVERIDLMRCGPFGVGIDIDRCQLRLLRSDAVIGGRDGGRFPHGNGEGHRCPFTSWHDETVTIA